MKIIDNNILTPRETEIVLLLLTGKNKREIAQTLNLSISTIKNNIEHIYLKFGVHSKLQLIIYTIQNKIIELD